MSAGRDAQMQLAARVIGAIRHEFEKNGFVEVLVPALRGSPGNPFSDSFQVDVRDGGPSFLSQGESYHLMLAARALGKVYCVDTCFRPAFPTTRNHLRQFHYVSSIFSGDLDATISLCRQILKRCIEVAVDVRRTQSVSSTPDSNAEPITVDYVEACRVIGIAPDKDMSLDNQLAVTKHYGRTAILLGVPTETQPFQFATHVDQKPLNFDLLAPFCGELGSGAVLETDASKFVTTFKSSPMYRAISDPGQDGLPAVVRPFADVLTSLATPCSALGFSLERMLQFLSNAPEIQSAVPFEDTNVTILSSRP